MTGCINLLVKWRRHLLLHILLVAAYCRRRIRHDGAPFLGEADKESQFAMQAWCASTAFAVSVEASMFVRWA